jgi:Ca2+-binding RTX toxin-like protein
MAVTITIRKATSFTVTDVDAFGTLHQVTVFGTGFTYDPAGNPVGGTVNTLVYADFGAPGVTVHSLSINGFGATPIGTLALQVSPPGLWYDPAHSALFAGYDPRLVTRETFYGQFAEVHGGSLADKLTGTAMDELVFGGLGNDRIYGNGGNDLLFGDQGNDVILANLSGPSRLFGGQGNDALTGGAFADILTGGTGIDALYAGAGDDECYGGSANDSLSGDQGNDMLWGETGDDRANGGAGDDQLFGEDGNDRLAGNADNDLVLGGNGNDNVQGGSGNDHLSGDAGNDSLNGGSGDDVIKFGDGSDNVVGLDGADLFVFALGGAAGVSNMVDFIAAEDFLALGDSTFNAGIARTAAENLAFFVSHSVDGLNGTTFTGSNGTQVFFRQVHLTQLSVANFVDTDGTAGQFL